jgi:hypothetical protein
VKNKIRLVTYMYNRAAKIQMMSSKLGWTMQRREVFVLGSRRRVVRSAGNPALIVVHMHSITRHSMPWLAVSHSRGLSPLKNGHALRVLVHTRRGQVEVLNWLPQTRSARHVDHSYRGGCRAITR